MARSCVLCHPIDEQVLWEDSHARVILVPEPGFRGFTRVIWKAHVDEMTELAPTDRNHVMQIVFAIEALQRSAFQPAKINLASLGNHVPHLHWHVIPRFEDDPCWPDSVWSPAHRAPVERELDLETYSDALSKVLDVV